MSSDTEDTASSSSSSSEEEVKRHKSSKRQKKKSEKERRRKIKKKSKEGKNRKRKRRYENHEDSPKMQNKVIENYDNANIFGPTLPPHLQQQPSVSSTVQDIQKNKIIGPVFDKNILENYDDHKEVEEKESTAMDDEDSDETVDIYGPTPINESGMSATQLELEQRALELKLAAIEGKNTNNIDIKTREEWMLELPEVGLKGGLAALATIKRKFHQGKEKPDFSDRSDWTKTPQSELEKQQKPTTSKQSAEAQEKAAEEAFVRKRDEEQERIAKRHKKKLKMEASLVEIHQKKLRKEQRKKEKELLKSGSKAERRPFTRDVDLKLNKIDSHQTKQIVDKAKILNTKFSTGHAKYL